jgi:ubiquinone/menaquinone biosynthesis C-methylase UbiE
MGWGIVVVSVVLIAAILYWQLIIAEGAYLGRRVVTLLYDWSAHIYDRIKHYNTGYEQYFLARPITNALYSFPNPVVLDVATGTARLARTLLPEAGFRGQIIGLDLSRKMLEQAASKTVQWSDRLTLLWDDASELPFPPDTFEVTACLEALEFMPDPEQVLAEMVRVLRPGGLFLTTNRIGKDARLMPGRTYEADELEAKLKALSLEMVQIRPWQVEYDLVWAVKPGVCAPVSRRKLEAMLRCPECKAAVSHQSEVLVCENGHAMSITGDGILDLLHVHHDRAGE